MPRDEIQAWLLQFGIREAAGLGGSIEPVTRMSRAGWTPRIDLFQHESFVLLRVELPGVVGTSVGLMLDADEGTLTVRGERQMPRLPRGRASALRLEIDEGPFERVVELPEGYYALGKAHAQLSDGMLSVLLPLEQESPATAERRCRISVRQG